jgi:hypothetical protein
VRLFFREPAEWAFRVSGDLVYLGMRTHSPCLRTERLLISCLVGALVLAACDDPSSTGQSKSPAKGSKADTPKDESEDDSEDDSPPKKGDAGKGTKPKPEAPAVPASDPNQIRPRDPPVHEPTAAADAGAAVTPTPTPTPTDSGAATTARDAGAPDAGRRALDAGRR